MYVTFPALNDNMTSKREKAKWKTIDSFFTKPVSTETKDSSDNIASKPQRDFVFHFFLKFLLFLNYLIFFNLYFFSRTTMCLQLRVGVQGATRLSFKYDSYCSQ
jgi:hypothetical protein